MNLGKESEKIEFKETVSEIDATIRSISSMLNRNNEGIVYFGVKDNGYVIGIDIANDTTLKIKEKIKTKIRPLIIPKIEELITHDNLKYIKIEAYGTNIPFGLTKEMVYNGFSRPINSGLFTIFMICQVAEQSGHGIPTIIKKYGRDAYDFSGDAIKVTIKFAFELVENDKNDKNNINTKTNDLVKEPQTNPKENVDNYCLSDKEKEILELIKHNSNITITKIATDFHCLIPNP